MPAPSIALGMIVKDEAHVIERCLNSVKDCFTEIVIHDTGSTDDTVKIIQKWIKANGKHGFVTSAPWQNFGANRTDVLKATQYCADYTLMFDADEVLEGTLKLDADLCDTYQMTVQLGGVSYRRNFLFKNATQWRYEGVVHEYPATDKADFTTGYIKKLQACVISHHDGARSKDPDKYEKDALLLESIPKRSPREMFYLAQSYKDNGDTPIAIDAYLQRAEMDGWYQEKAYSLYMAGKLADATTYLLNAFESDPRRAEPLLAIGKYFMNAKRWHTAHLFLNAAVNLIPEDDMLFREDDVYRWRTAMELAVCNHYRGEFAEAASLNTWLLNSRLLPDEHKPQVQANLKFAKEEMEKLKAKAKDA